LQVSELTKLAVFGGFFSYIAGTAAAVINDYFPGGGASSYIEEQGIYIINYKTTLPMRKGLSSSAAACVMIAKCFNEVYGLGMGQAEFMEAAYKGEMMTPSRCGRMDQVGRWYRQRKCIGTGVSVCLSLSVWSVVSVEEVCVRVCVCLSVCVWVWMCVSVCL
jgi:hypothetical protein